MALTFFLSLYSCLFVCLFFFFFFETSQTRPPPALLSKRLRQLHTFLLHQDSDNDRKFHVDRLCHSLCKKHLCVCTLTRSLFLFALYLPIFTFHPQGFKALTFDQCYQRVRELENWQFRLLQEQGKGYSMRFLIHRFLSLLSSLLFLAIFKLLCTPFHPQSIDNGIWETARHPRGPEIGNSTDRVNGQHSSHRASTTSNHK